jgi:hypothetical protein
MEVISAPTYLLRHSEKASLEAALSKEVFLPDNVDLTVFLGGHSEKEDFTALQPHIAESDIFIPETPEWTEEGIALYSRVSQGDKDAYIDLLFAGGEPLPFHAARALALLGSNLRITAIDIPASDPHSEYIANHFENRHTYESMLGEVVDSNFDQTLDNILKLADAIQHNATIAEACRHAKISKTTFYWHLNNEQVFAEKMATAKDNQNKAVFSFLTTF